MTYPNHISIATGGEIYSYKLYITLYCVLNLGMYQEDHGIIHNSFYDRLLNKTIGMSLDFHS
jgi:hypothetical protein